MNKTDKIYVAGHRGMVGSAIVRCLEKQGYTNIITRTHKELDLTNQAAVEEFFAKEKPDYVLIHDGARPFVSRQLILNAVSYTQKYEACVPGITPTDTQKEIDGDIRIVRRGDADICACCGTHVKSTGQVGVITVISSQKFNGGTRIFAACGKRAVDFAAARNADCHEISRLLSSPLDAIVPAVESL